nr:energy coupling factor transporter S component ThiW [Bacillota bacterium]
SLLRNFLGLGTLLAFPGSMIGALLAGVFYVRFGRESLALVGEVIGTGILGALASYPIAAFVLKNKTTAFFYVFPFTLSSLVGAVIAYLILKALRYLFKQEKESGK